MTLLVARSPRLLAVCLALALVAACTPDRDAPSASALATIAAVPSTSASPTGEPAPTDDAATAGGPDAAATLDPANPVRPTVSPTPLPEAAEADREEFSMNLAKGSDFVAQYTFEWCVGASIQMALNMATDESRTSKADQRRLWEMARDRSSSPFGGANPRGWTATLNDLGLGPYVLVSLPTFDEALVVAAEAIRVTKRPVGLVMWRGRHAWVMSGFRSNGDPALADDPEITGIRVHDPLYPHGSAVWGKSPKPNSLISPTTLARQFVIRTSRRVNLGVPPGYLLILPTEAAT
ncbi:MAG: hypothetical protein ACRDIL_03525 [Candidatus Limnocylindrales bacterium]